MSRKTDKTATRFVLACSTIIIFAQLVTLWNVSLHFDYLNLTAECEIADVPGGPYADPCRMLEKFCNRHPTYRDCEYYRSDDEPDTE